MKDQQRTANSHVKEAWEILVPSVERKLTPSNFRVRSSLRWVGLRSTSASLHIVHNSYFRYLAAISTPHRCRPISVSSVGPVVVGFVVISLFENC